MTAIGFIARLFQPDLLRTGFDMRRTFVPPQPTFTTPIGFGCKQPLLCQWRAVAMHGAAALFAMSCLASSVAAQTRSELANLVFDAEPLTSEVQQTSQASDDVNATDGDAVSTPAGSNSAEVAVEGEGEGSSNGASTDGEVDPLLVESANPRDSQTQIDRYRRSITELSQRSDTPYSEALREQQSSLAALLKETGDHAGAITALESAMHIDRVNHGLFTPRQVDLVNQLIQNNNALGNYDKVSDLEEYLYYIQTKTYADDDPRYIAATERWADWNVESFLKTGPEDRFGDALSYSSSTAGGPGYVAVQSANGMVYFVPRDRVPFMRSPGMPGGFADPRMSPYAMTPEMLVDQRLRKARSIYQDLQENESVSAEHKADLQRKTANIAFTVKRQMDAMTATNRGTFGFNSFAVNPINPVVSRGYQENVTSLETLAQQLEADPNASADEKSAAYVDLGDWHLSFERFRPATDAYRKAWELLGSPAESAPALHPVLHPEYLMPVPTFVKHPYSRELNGIAPDANLDYIGYIDVSVGIDKRGRVASPRIIGSSEGTSQTLRNALLDYLRNSRMRPFMQNGETTEVNAFAMRFHYTY
jgi:tetratricopeptide (TPR) repeat protein